MNSQHSDSQQQQPQQQQHQPQQKQQQQNYHHQHRRHRHQQTVQFRCSNFYKIQSFQQLSPGLCYQIDIVFHGDFTADLLNK